MSKVQADAAECIPQTRSLSASRYLSLLRQPLLWILLSAFLYLIGVRSLALNDNDAMYPQIAPKCCTRATRVTPRLDGVAHFDKPPLIYWLNAVSLRLLGQTDAARVLACPWRLSGNPCRRRHRRLALWKTRGVVEHVRIQRMCVLFYCRVIAVSADIILCFWTALAILAYIGRS